MADKERIFTEIDNIIQKIDGFKTDIFDEEKANRQNKEVSILTTDSEILKIFSYLVAYSQNANSELVEQVLKSNAFDKAFEGFDIDRIVKLNPCDIADNHWESIKGIRQQAKLFHIVSLARKIKTIGSFSEILNETNIPKSIKKKCDINDFWIGFDKLLSTLKANKIPFFQSTTSLLHFLLEMGYDCLKPDLVVMKVAKKINIVDSAIGDKNLRKAVRTVQEYCIERNLRPAVIDLYFLIDEGQMGAKKYVQQDFYKK